MRTLATCALALGLCAAAAPSVGCATLSVTRINSAEENPGNVWVFFTVEEDEEPVPGLAAEDFNIYEDDKLVSQFESKQVILNPDVAAVMYTLLLIDMSGSITESGEADTVVDAAHSFTERVGESQKVGVYAFDGGEDIYSVVRFTEAKGSVDGGLEGLRTYQPRDPSTNLNGAVMQGIKTLDEALQKDKRPIKLGTLVVFTDGTDRAHRVSQDEMLEELGQEQYANYEVYVIGVGAEIERGNLTKIGRDGTELAEDDEKVQNAFDRVANRIEAHQKRFYLLSYCTPSRRGDHAVRIEAESKNDKGKTRAKGDLEYGFSAEGFGPPPDCNPERAPTFRMDRHLDPAPEDDDGNGSGPSKTRRSAARGGPGERNSEAKGKTSKGKGKAKAKGSFRGEVRPPGGG